jgi:radical SAM superfamily enzyme YgiQ (UPF0313 family)
MKTLLVRPGIELVERTFRGPWPPHLAHIQSVYTDYSSLFRGLFEFQTFSQSSTLAVGTVLMQAGEDIDYLDVPFEVGISLTEKKRAEKYKKIEDFISRGGYDVVGISCTGSLEGVSLQYLAEAAKKTGAVVVAGGYQAAAAAYDFMEAIPSLDVIVLSDIEPLVNQLYAALRGEYPMKKVPNIIYRENQNILTTEKKCILLTPDMLPRYDYRIVKKYVLYYSLFAIEASRGCHYTCAFCQEKVMRQSYTVKDAVKTADEIVDTANYLAHITTPVIFYFCDALWGSNPAWVKRFLTHLIKKKKEITTDLFGWVCEARVGQFTREQLALMKKAGCITIGYGVESLSPKMLKIMNKTKNPQKYIDTVFKTVEKTLEQDIHTVLLFILGMPGETPATLEKTKTTLARMPFTNEKFHIKFGLPDVLRSTFLDALMHDPLFVKEHGTTILEENDWKKGYIPRFTLLFDPSRELSAANMTEIFLDLMHGIHSLTASFGKQLETYKDIDVILDKGEISPYDLATLGSIYRKAVTGTF